ncbi:hypothetical protein ACFL21_01435 [Patescibacteria group bacterium]
MNMFWKKKITRLKANRYLGNKIEEYMLPCKDFFKEVSEEKNSWIKIPDKAINGLIHELLFIFIYLIQVAKIYEHEDEINNLLQDLPPSVKNNKKIDITKYLDRFQEIDEVMKFVFNNAQNQGGIGSGILSFCLRKLPNEVINEIKINPTEEILEFFTNYLRLNVNDIGKDELLYSGFPMMSGVVIGEMIRRFIKELNDHFKWKKVIK